MGRGSTAMRSTAVLSYFGGGCFGGVFNLSVRLVLSARTHLLCLQCHESMHKNLFSLSSVTSTVTRNKHKHKTFSSESTAGRSGLHPSYIPRELEIEASFSFCTLFPWRRAPALLYETLRSDGLSSRHTFDLRRPREARTDFVVHVLLL